MARCGRLFGEDNAVTDGAMWVDSLWCIGRRDETSSCNQEEQLAVEEGPVTGKVDDGEESECEAVPLPIQTFLWRQTNPFLGAKVGKLHEASCVVSGVSLRLSTVGIPFIHF
ncbi:hypothetical protein OSTOST_13647, partial [Ostertagia ostertagi]